MTYKPFNLDDHPKLKASLAELDEYMANIAMIKYGSRKRWDDTVKEVMQVHYDESFDTTELEEVIRGYSF